VQKCTTKEGTAQELCKQEADADFDAARAHAKAARAAQNLQDQ
jgi:hypothetical protein